MPWLVYVSYFFGGLFGANSIPHLVSGMMGRPFPSPFGKPPGKGLSSPTVNVLWGAFNLLVAYGLILHVGAFDLRNPWEVAAMAAGGVVTAVQCSRHFGQLNRGITAR